MLCVKLFLELFVSSALHYGKQDRHHPHFLQRPFLVLPNGWKPSIREIGWNILSTWSKRLKMSTKVLILAPELNVCLISLSFPQCTGLGTWFANGTKHLKYTFQFITDSTTELCTTYLRWLSLPGLWGERLAKYLAVISTGGTGGERPAIMTESTVHSLKTQSHTGILMEDIWTGTVLFCSN